MEFVTKKEADAYDKMLDIADNLFNFLGDANLKLDETKQEEISLLLAERRDEVMPILRGVTPKKGTAPAKKSSGKSAAKKSAAGKSSTGKASAKAAKPRAAAKKAVG